MSQKIAYEQYAQQFLSQLPKGAFLTVKDGERINTMTIGWGSIGFIWQKPVLMVMVRHSRFTHELIDQASDFSVSVPSSGELRKALAIAGSQSGRDVDKFHTCSLTAQPAQSIDSPVIGECGLIFECRLVFRSEMDPSNLDDQIRANSYASEDYHVLYFGEILACYELTGK